MVKVIGILTFDTVFGLKRHLRKALVAELSRIGFPVLEDMLASVTLPLAVSTETMTDPLPVMWRLRAS